MQANSQTITIALSKGRPLKETLPLFAAVGIEPLEDVHTSRKLIFETTQPNVRMIIIRSADVPTYVQYGVADLGVTGKDVLLEHGAEDMYELLDLGVSRCKLMTAKIKGAQPPLGKIKVATKFINVARQYYAKKGQQVELIKLHGGMELAPIMNLADVIVDIVDTGNTLKANGLETDEYIADVSARVIASRLALKMKDEKINPIIEMLKNAVNK
ncbi:ATP phosphoribosyltransferase [Reinekea thalattae]|uniref:ATP phosphoribosyltransferase n=1 Tax=Reinekea thalattae TaxID=2593301 RepID=A0A5C8Z3P8_9GAMM|nr:ATP phosphoribosyltransferase [Reinekea thalattae]TXR52177.1 ATP phosphoribosyltransferase [Reinekea thalattae]